MTARLCDSIGGEKGRRCFKHGGVGGGGTNINTEQKTDVKAGIQVGEGTPVNSAEFVIVSTYANLEKCVCVVMVAASKTDAL